MKLIEFEVFSFIFVVIPWGAYIHITQMNNMFYGFLVVGVACVFNLKDTSEDQIPEIISNEFSGIAAITVFTPLLLTTICFYIYDSLDDAFWVFILSSWTLGAIVAGLISLLKRERD